MRYAKPDHPVAKLSKKLQKCFGKTNVEYRLIGEGDRVLVGLSGGKDSLALVHLLSHMQRHAPFSFYFEAVTVSYGMPEENYEALHKHCETYGIIHHIYETKIFDIAQETIRENSSFCSYFSRMRRGALYTFAAENDFNKVALGHHLDDMAESFFMNMLYNGTLRAMAPIYRSEKGFEVIRPLIRCRESQLRGFAQSNGFETIGDEACPAMRMQVKYPFARAQTKAWLAQMEKEHPDLFKKLQSAFAHIHDDTFLDPARWKR